MGKRKWVAVATPVAVVALAWLAWSALSGRTDVDEPDPGIGGQAPSSAGGPRGNHPNKHFGPDLTMHRHIMAARERRAMEEPSSGTARARPDSSTARETAANRTVRKSAATDISVHNSPHPSGSASLADEFPVGR